MRKQLLRQYALRCLLLLSFTFSISSARAWDPLAPCLPTCSNSLLSCNHAEWINTGFQFYGSFGTGIQFAHNVMDNNAYGFVLNGLIGPQGTIKIPSDNEWIVDPATVAWTTFTWAGTNYGTFTIGTTDANNSILYVRHVSGFVPPNDNGFFGSFQYVPGPLYGIAYTPTPSTVPDCLGYHSPSGIGFGGGGDTTGTIDSMMEMAARQELDFSSSVKLKNWEAQKAVWEALAVDSTQADSSATLQQFRTMAAGRSRYAYLASIENSLANGDTTTATTMLATPMDSLANTDSDAVTGVRMADDTGADLIVNNYCTYYHLYLHYLKGCMSSSDSVQTFTMSLLCPMLNGTVVYNARALYSLIYDDMRVFDDNDCDDSTKLVSKQPSDVPGVTDASGGQQYSLYPNPSDGNFTVQQLTADKQPVLAEVWNALGQSMYKSVLNFEQGKVQMEYENLTPGIYLLQLRDSTGRMFTLKFTVENRYK